MFFYPKPGYRLGDAVEFCISEYSSEFEEYWGHEAPSPPEGVELDTWVRYVHLAASARRLAQDASRLVKPGGVQPSEWTLPDILQSDAKDHDRKIEQLLQEVRDRYGDEIAVLVQQHTSESHLDDPRVQNMFFENAFELEVARLFLPDVSNQARRALGLLRQSHRHHGRKSTAYLERVARCYVLDLAPEMAVMSRAVLETAIEERISDADVIDLVGFGKGGHVGLDRRIEYIEARGLLSASALSSARVIKRAGDAAAHGDLDQVPTCDELLTALTHVQDGFRSVPLKTGLAD